MLSLQTNKCRIAVGTSGYSYKDWVGPVYPEGTPPQAYLSHYIKHFSMVELNFSYYKQPSAGMMQNMVTKVPEDFLFCIKAHKSLTHQPDSQWELNIKQYKEGITPLKESGKLGAILFQFPYSYHYTKENRKYLDALLNHFVELPVVIEFRNREWQRPTVLEGLKARMAGYVNVDLPEIEGLPVREAVVTSSIAYIRFHGRNEANWWSGDNTTRYDYLYKQNELESWISQILDITKKATLLLVAFNNHFKGQAVKNALELLFLLRQKGL